MIATIKILISILTLSYFGKAEFCDMLENGKYKVQFDNQFNEYENFQIKIFDSTYIKYFTSGDSTVGKLKWWYKCSLFLEPEIKAVPDSSTELERLLQKSFGKPIIRFENSYADTIFFITTYSAQLHLTLNRGKFIRQ